MRWVGSEISVEVVIECRQRADAARHHRHRMRVAPKALIETAHLLVHHRVEGDTIVEVGLLRGGRKFAVEQEIAGLQEIAVLGQLLDRIAAIKQDALVAVDIGDLRLAAAGRGVAGIVGEHPGLGVELADIDDGGTDRSLVDRERVLLVADDELAGFDVGAGLGIHDRALGCVARRTALPAVAVGWLVLLLLPYARGEPAFCVAHPNVRCKMAPRRRLAARNYVGAPAGYGQCLEERKSALNVVGRDRRDLVPQPAEALALPQDRQDVEDGW